MEGASAATASGCDYDESLTQKESLTTVASGCDAFSPPSTSNPNPGPESPFVPSLEDECYSSGFNEDFMQGIEKPTSPFVGGKAPVRLNVSDDDESQSDDESQPDDESQTDDKSQPDDESQTDDESQFESQMMAGWDGLSAHSTSKTDSSLNMSYASSSDDDSYSSRYRDDFMQEIKKSMSPFVSDKEPLSALAAEFESGSPIIQEKIKLLGEKYTALRRTRGDGNCFYRSFMFSYLEHILVTENRAELDRVLVNIEQCRVDLFNLGYAEFTYEDFFGSFTELLEGCLPGTKASLSLTELLEKACDQITSNCAVMFLRFVTSAAIQKRAEFFEPFVSGLSHKSVAQFCKTSVEPMGEESEEVHIIALSDALGVPIRVVYLDSHISGDPENPTAAANHHDFFPSANNNLENNGSNCTDAANVSTDLSKQENPAPLVTLLYRPGHYDILYPL